VSIRQHPFPKLDGKSVQHGLPVFHWHRPLLGYVVQHQIKQFEQRIVAGERPTVLRDFAQTHVHRLDGVGRVDDLPYLGRIVEERRDAIGNRPLEPKD
jgi:hypothetical protein